jgi:hypothetical protein
VIGKRLGRGEDHQLAGRIRDIRVGRNLKARQGGVPGQIGKVNDKAAAGRVVRIKGHAEEPLFADIGNARAQIEERIRQ